MAGDWRLHPASFWLALCGLVDLRISLRQCADGVDHRYASVRCRDSVLLGIFVRTGQGARPLAVPYVLLASAGAVLCCRLSGISAGNSGLSLSADVYNDATFFLGHQRIPAPARVRVLTDVLAAQFMHDRRGTAYAPCQRRRQIGQSYFDARLAAGTILGAGDRRRHGLAQFHSRLGSLSAVPA